MGASQFVGRVGGLAVALGVGAAVVAGAGAASADRGSAPDNRGSGSDSGSSQSSAPTGRGAGSGRTASPAASAVAAQRNRNSSPVSSALADEPVSVPAPAAAEPAPAPAAAVAPAADPAPAPVKAAEAVAVDPVAAADPVVEDVVEPVVVAEPAPEVAPAPEVVAYSAAGSATSTGGAGSDPSAPVGHPIVDLLLASVIRRETKGAPSALVTAGATSGLTADPKVTFYDGILQGNLNATTDCTDCTLEYSLAGSSAGGKARFDNVPVALDPLLPVGAKGGPGSFTLLPYATWIDPANPTRFPAATGTQDFTVQISESTKFDKQLAALPIVGELTKSFVRMLQTTPFLGNLLAPLIGSAILQTISVNVGDKVPAGQQVAYTYTHSSWDGTPISLNYFPAAAPSLLPNLGNQQATIFNGPGLGGAGATNPYSSNETSGTVPGLALMRGQGLPGQLATAPLGFNVITWDPRGEWASGGTLQLDNPFYEGRDVSSLIDWANANTPLLNEGGKPDVAMLGGSYGGMIQMTTVDPRIKAIVPSIAPNSALDSLYPNQVFKTAWANTLADALLFTGASSLDRINNQITVALATGNLFGFISEVGQAVIASSGPTVLLKKLNAPTMYTQGTHDALFPLQEALNNARTQLDENPFFAGANANLVKMIWFCGGHGFCSTQTLKQQEQQATVMFLENMVWVNKYTKDYLAGIPPINSLLNGFLSAIAPFQWWDQNGTALASFTGGMPWTKAFQNTAPVVATNAEGGRVNSFTSVSGPLTTEDPAGVGCQVSARLCQWPLKQVFATQANNAVEVAIPIASGPTYVVGAPTVSFTYTGRGNAKALYAQIVDNATGQVLGNIVTPVPVTLDGKEHTVTDFPIADIAYTSPASSGKGLTLQIVGRATLYNNNAVIWSADISNVSVKLPTTSTAIANPVPGLIPA